MKVEEIGIHEIIRLVRGRVAIGYYNSLEEQAAALAKSLADNHGFVDGNRRLAITATDTSLRLTVPISLSVKGTFTFHANPDLALIAANLVPLVDNSASFENALCLLLAVHCKANLMGSEDKESTHEIQNNRCQSCCDRWLELWR